METDLHLLSLYHRRGDAAAFHSLMKVHAGMVFAVARRITQNAALAEEVVQDTFLALARRGASIQESVAAWLHHVARQKACNAIRGEQRRQRYEQAAVEVLHEDKDGSWAEIEPVVDEVLDALPEERRVLLIEHFLEQRTQEEMARRLRLSQSTVSRQIDAALQMLREGLRKKGVVCGLGLAGLLNANSVQAAPATLHSALGKIAVSGVRSSAAGTGSASTSASSLLITMTTTTKAILATGTLAALSLPFLLPPRTAPAPASVVAQSHSKSGAAPEAQEAAHKAMPANLPPPDPDPDSGPTAAAPAVLDDQQLILAEFKRMGGTITQIGEKAINDEIAARVAKDFGNDPAAFERDLERQGMSLEQFKTGRLDAMTVSIMKARITQGISDPEEKKRVFDEWLTDLRMAAVTGVRPARTGK
ncbi:RNA polymerase sigma factor [Prosthecobacter sp.]|uniref:RNA polymerase sigma factor n=1 Tax=Prosthecobacter sp. TaxID=1965333 RepID=UPI003784FEA2